MRALFLMFGLIACLENGNEESEEQGIQYEYYDASTLITLENADMEFAESYLVRRSLCTIESEIFEEFYSTDDGTLVSVTLDVDMNDKTFVLAFSDDSYTGEGTYEGTGLDWTSWESQSNHSDGTYVMSQDFKDASGIHTTKVGYGMTGGIEWRLVENLATMSKDDWEIELAELLDE
tara:strand:+ start:67 stop:597 length:531 start_codon:yes stop_codon:yes gene_type:complete